MGKRYFVTGIDTGIGKTVVSAVLTEALEADYWKPVQTGYPEDSDRETVQSLISNSRTKFWPESYAYKAPLSPHAAAALEQEEIDPENISIPETDNNLIIEGAGGIMVPLNKEYMMLDLIKGLNCSVILVSKNYLGSINHTLLSLKVLTDAGVEVKGIVFNGEPYESSENVITSYAGCEMLFRLPWTDQVTKEWIREVASLVRI